MNDLNKEQKNAILDGVILERRTHRRFKEDIPSVDSKKIYPPMM